MYRLLADAALAAHLAFIVFVLGGGLLAVFWRPWFAWIHLPAAVWGAFVEIMGWTCPLTTLENRFLELAGGGAYRGDFIAHYLLMIIYPAGLTTVIQEFLGGLVIVLNGIVYTAAVIRIKRRAT